MTFGARLREARKALGLTQAELGTRAGMSAANIAHFELGQREPTLGSFKRLALATGMSADWLLGFDANRVEHAALAELLRLRKTITAALVPQGDPNG